MHPIPHAHKTTSTTGRQRLISQQPPKKTEFTEDEVDVAATKAKRDIDVLFNRTEPHLFKEFKDTKFLYSTLAWNEIFEQDERAKQLSYSALISVLTTQKLNGLVRLNLINHPMFTALQTQTGHRYQLRDQFSLTFVLSM